MPHELVYRFDELSEEAKDRVCESFREDGSDRGGEALASLEALAKHFGGSLGRYDIDWTDYGRSTVRFHMPDCLVYESEAEDEDGNLDEEKLQWLHRKEIQRLLDELGSYDPKTLRGLGDCALTGVCYDESAIDGFRKAFMAGENDLTELMREAFYSLHSAVEKDHEYDTSYEGIEERCADDWFDEDGNYAQAPDSAKGRYSKSAMERAQRMATAHGLCSAGRCVEYAQNKDVPRCALGRKAKPKKRRR